MGTQFTLLIADRNRHVRDFLRREFTAEGYLVDLAKDGKELVTILDSAVSHDLLILDLDMPCAGGPELLEHVLESKPLLPVVVHTFLTDDTTHSAIQKAAAFLEKSGTNLDQLKEVVISVLRKCYPSRFGSMEACDGDETP